MFETILPLEANGFSMKKFLFINIFLLVFFLNIETIQAQNVCTGDPRLNIVDAQNCANTAQTQGTMRGLRVSCQPEIQTYPTTNPQAGPGYYYNIPCTVNGSTEEYDAVFLAGYNGTAITGGNLNPLWWMFTNQNPTTNTNNNSNNTSPIPSGGYCANGLDPRVLDSSGNVIGYNENPWAGFLSSGSADAQAISVALIAGQANMVFAQDWLKANVPLCSTTPRSGAPSFVTQYQAWLSSRQGGNNSTTTNNNNSTQTISGYVGNAIQTLTYLNQINSNNNSYFSQTPVFQPQTIQTTPSNQNNNNQTTAVYCGIMSDLRLGDSGANVLSLTNYLVSQNVLSAPKNNFDNEVFNAVIAYQEKYSSEILAPVGLTRGTGFVGSSTRNHINSRITCPSTNNNSGGTIPPSTSAQTLQAQISELQAIVQTLLQRLAQMANNQ